MIEYRGRRLINRSGGSTENSHSNENLGAQSQGPEQKSKHPPLAEASGVSQGGRFNSPGRYDWSKGKWLRGHMHHLPLLQASEAFHSLNRQLGTESKAKHAGN
jgi:hypothetical protein